MKKAILSLLTVFLLIITSVRVAFAVEAPFANGSKFVKLATDEKVNKDYFAGGDEIQVSGTVNGDAYIGGGQVRIDGTVNGDLLVAGGDVNISGTVTQDIRVVGGQVTFSGKVGSNLTVAGGNIVITDAAEIDGNLVIGAGNVEVGGTVAGDLTAGAGNLVISGKVGGGITAGVGQLSLASKAQIGGNLTYWSDTEARIDDKDSVAGSIDYHKTPGVAKRRMERMKVPAVRARYAGKIYSFVTSLLVGLLLLHFYPKYVEETRATLRKRPLAALTVGFLALFFTPIIAVFLLITVIGIPLSLILLVAYGLYLYLAKIFIAFFLGVIILEKASQKTKPAWAFVLGLIVYYLLTLIVVVKGIVIFFSLLFGLGTSLITCRQTYLAARKKGVI